jgi:hypothetical protein
LLVTGLFLLMFSACTVQYSRELSRTALRDIGMGTSVKVSRTGSWALPEGTAVHLAPTFVAGADPHAYPRLSSHLDRLLESIASEWFHSEGFGMDAALLGSRAESGVLLRLSLASAVDQLSSVRELADSRGLSSETSGRDRLHLVMKIYDARTGQLLDTMTGEAVSGWRWREHRLADLAEPTLRVMLARLRGAATSVE